MKNQNDINTIIYTLRDIMHFLQKEFRTPQEVLLKLLCVKLICELDGIDLTSSNIDYILQKYKDLFEDLSESKFINDKFKITIDRLSEIKFSELSTQERALILQNIFKETMLSKSIGVYTPPKVVEAMLSNIYLSEQSIILNQMASLGDIFINLASLNNQISLKNIYFSEPNHANAELLKLVYFFITKQQINDKFTYELSDKSSEFDVVIANPPFGMDNKLQNKYENLHLTAKITRNHAFQVLTHCQRKLRPSGKTSIIIPDGLLMMREFRDWLPSYSYIKKIISLPSGSFKPYANVKTSILVLEKKHNLAEENYNISCELINDIEVGVEKKSKITVSEFISENFNKIFVDSFNPEDAKKYSGKGFLPLYEAVEIVSRKSDKVKSENIDIKYFEISSIEALTGKINKVQHITSKKDLPSRAYYEVKEGDVVIAVSGGALGTKSQVAAVISKEFDGYICTNGFRVLRPRYGVNPHYLWYFLRSDIFLQQVQKYIPATTIPNLKQKDLENINIYLPDMYAQLHIADKLEKTLKQYEQAKHELSKTENYINAILERRNSYDD